MSDEQHLTVQDMERVVVGAMDAKETKAAETKATEKKENRKFWLKLAPVIITALAASGFGINAAVPKAPEAATADTVQDDAKTAKRERMSNTIQIDKLGGEVVQLKDAQAVSPSYIIGALSSDDPDSYPVPPELEAIATDDKAKKQRAKKKKVLAVSDDELDAALEAAAEAEGED